MRCEWKGFTYAAQTTAWPHSTDTSAAPSSWGREKTNLSSPASQLFLPFFSGPNQSGVVSNALLKLALYSIYDCYILCSLVPWDTWHGFELRVPRASQPGCIMAPDILHPMSMLPENVKHTTHCTELNRSLCKGTEGTSDAAANHLAIFGDRLHILIYFSIYYLSHPQTLRQY